MAYITHCSLAWPGYFFYRAFIACSISKVVLDTSELTGGAESFDLKVIHNSFMP